MANIFASRNALVFTGCMAALLYVINFFSGQILSIVFTIPGLSGVVTGFTVPLLLIVTYLVTKRIGAITIVWTLYSIAAIPTALMGPPGFYKVAIGLIAGLVFDFIIFLFRGKKISFYVGFIFYTLTMMGLFLFCLKYFNLPGFDITTKAVTIITAVFIFEGLIAVNIGERVSNRLISIGNIQKYSK